MSHFIYADTVMARLDFDSKRRLQVAFNSITRYVYSVSRYHHITPFNICLLGCTLENYFKYRQCVAMFNIINEFYPSYLSEKIRISRSTRNLSIIIPKHKYAFRANNFFINGAQNWNLLPLSIKRIARPSEFKNHCFSHFANT